MRECIRSAAACVVSYYDAILGNMRISGKKYVVSET